MNTNTVSCIQYCGWLSRWIPLQCGIRQGCPLSPLCFILECHIRQNKNIKGITLPISVDGRQEIKIMQYADDSTLFLADEPSVHYSLLAVEAFSN